jgi:hypothetical protein
MIERVRSRTDPIADGARVSVRRVAVVCPLDLREIVTDLVDGLASVSVTRLASLGVFSGRSVLLGGATEAPPARLLRRIESP